MSFLEHSHAFIHVSEHAGKNTISPFFCLQVFPTDEFVFIDGLGSNLLPDSEVVLLRGRKSLGEILPDGRLTETRSLSGNKLIPRPSMKTNSSVGKT
jgi:hypothetical protein